MSRRFVRMDHNALGHSLVCGRCEYLREGRNPKGIPFERIATFNARGERAWICLADCEDCNTTYIGQLNDAFNVGGLTAADMKRI